MSQKIQKIIEDSALKNKKQKKEFLLFGTIMIFIQDHLVSDLVDFDEVIAQIELLIPSSLLHGIDIIYVGNFQDLIDRDLEAAYDSGGIYITNFLSNNIDYIENIVHEAAHALEKNRGLMIYGDRKIEMEFLAKRERLFHNIKSEGYNIEGLNYLGAEYQEEFDSFLYQEIGYEKLSHLINGLFLNPYAVTSLSEYFASGFEKYMLDGEDRRYLQTISHALVEKIEELINGY